MGLTRVLGAIVLVALLNNPVQALTTTGPYSVTLAWDADPSPEVTGYRVYYGEASGNYTDNIVLGKVTTVTVPSLSSDVTYFFAVTAFDAYGTEGPRSTEITFVPGLQTVRIRMASNRQVSLKVTGKIGHTYYILATQNLKDWAVIAAVTIGASGSVDFTDANAASFAKRFYRTLKSQP